MPALRRGFKTEAESIAAEMRREMSLAPSAALDPFALAAHLEIPVEPLSAFHTEAPAAIRGLRGRWSENFSAITVFDGPRRWIVHNDAHAQVRQASDVAHELSHALLFHEPTPAIGDDGSRDWNPAYEAEASWLGGVLLIPAPAALHIVSGGLSAGVAAALYGVSEAMLRYRLKVTGAATRVQRSAGFRRGGTGDGVSFRT